MIHLIWHSYIKRGKLLISATLLPNLLYLDDHFAPTGNNLLHAVVELEEALLTLEYEPGSMGLADEDTALAKPERTIARLHHGTRKGIKSFQTPELMTLALHAAKLAGFGERQRGR